MMPFETIPLPNDAKAQAFKFSREIAIEIVDKATLYGEQIEAFAELLLQVADDMQCGRNPNAISRLYAVAEAVREKGAALGSLSLAASRSAE